MDGTEAGMAPPLPWLTLERAAFALLLAVAALARLVGLAGDPLSPEESARALSAWSLAGGNAPEWWQAPAFVLPTAAVFWVAGASDAAARLLPALAGVAGIAVVWLFRGWLGSRAALIAVGLLAVSPTGWAAARAAREETLAVAVTALLLWWLLREAPTAQATRLWPALAGAAVLLNLGAAGITGALALLLGAAVWYALQPANVGPISLSGPLERRSIVRYAAGFLAAMVALSTGLLLHPAGIGLPSLTAWALAAGPSPEGQAWYQWWLLFSGYELGAVAVGVPASVAYLVGWARHPNDAPSRVRGLWSVWALVALAVYLAAGRATLPSMAMAAFPLTVVTAVALSGGLAALRPVHLRAVAPAALAGVVLLALTYLAAANAVALNTDQWRTLAVLVSITAGLVAVVAWTSPAPRAVLSLAGLFAVVFYALQASGGLAASGLRPYDAAADNTGITPLAERLRLAAFRDDGPTVAIESSLKPVFSWPLRDAPGVVYMPSVQPGPNILVGRDQATALSLEGYRRTVLPVAREWTPGGWTWAGLWRWVVWNQPADAAPQDQRIVMLVRE